MCGLTWDVFFKYGETRKKYNGLWTVLEELAGLCAPWGSVRETSFDDPLARQRQFPDTSSTNGSAYARKDSSLTPRRSSLPPLYKNQYNSTDRYEREKEFGGETSGYGSDNPNVPECPKTANPNWHQNGYESSSSCREDRPRWGDRGVAVGNKFWGSRENLSYQKPATSEPPGWVKRGLEGDTQIVVANSSPAESPQQDCADSERPSTTSSNNPNRTYIRGQNAPIDQLEIMERERRRQAALAHQEAIRKQLEEREQRRKEEKERRIQEEREEELRIEREQEMERRKREKELKALQEKQEREQKRKEAIQEAMEIAEKEAKMEKMKLKLMKQNNINLTECIVEKEKIPTPRDDCNSVKMTSKNEANETTKMNNSAAKMNNLDKHNNSLSSSNNGDKNHIENDNRNLVASQKTVSPRERQGENENSATYNKENKINHNLEKAISRRNSVCNNNNDEATSHNNVNNNHNANSNVNMINATVYTPQLTPRIENVALLLQPTLDSYQNMQYAVLVPNINPTTHTAIPIAVPIPITTDRDLYTARTENRILTPTTLRNSRTFCDSSTQTDYIDFGRLDTSDLSRGRFVTEKMNNLDINYETNRSRNKERRSSRTDDRSREERPKWGANRPPTRYMKQSEKDPLYQRRKLRQKMRETKPYDDKNSSDESQTASPRSYRKKIYVEKRHTRALWRKGDQMFGRNNIKMYQTEIIPLEADKDQIYYKQSCDRECCCHCRCSRKRQEPKVDILKIEHNSPRDNARPDLLPPDFNDNDNTFVDTSEQFSSLNNDILSQEQWDNTSVRSPNLSESIRYHN